jgi:transcriptional regulator with XRE-family HTH domain
MNYYLCMKSASEPIRRVLAVNVKKCRNDLQYSQEKLAERAKLSVQTIKDIEGCRRWVSDNTLTRLARALNTTEFRLLIPEKYEIEKKYRKSPVKGLTSLKEKLKSFMDIQFEKAINSDDFT